jgi:hypothetical protein
LGHRVRHEVDGVRGPVQGVGPALIGDDGDEEAPADGDRRLERFWGRGIASFASDRAL